MIFAKRVLIWMVSAVVVAVWLPSVCFAGANAPPTASAPSDFVSLVGQPADIAFSAYQYRADRKPDENPPESWLALLHFAKLPLNRPVDTRALAIRRALCSLLWEEIRPVQKLELTWSGDTVRQPAPKELIVTTLNNKGSASSWWNNLVAVRQTVEPVVSADGKRYVYDLGSEVCGIVIAVTDAKTAADFDVPTVRALVPDRWKRMDVEVEWGFAESTAEQDYSGRLETYDGRVADLRPLDGDANTTVTDISHWRSRGKSAARRGVRFSLLYIGSSTWRATQPFTSQKDDVARTIVTLWTKGGDFSFLAADLENGPILAPEYGFFVRMKSALPSSSPERTTLGPRETSAKPPIKLASKAASAREFIGELADRKLSTIRERTRRHSEQSWESAMGAMHGADLPPHPAPPAEFEPTMQVRVPSERLTAQWRLGAWHLLRHAQRNPQNGRLWFNDYPYGILGAETYMILGTLDKIGSHQAAADGFDQWLSLPLEPKSTGHHEWALPDRPNGLFSDGRGCLTHAVGPKGVGGQMDGVHAFGPGSIGWKLTEHHELTGDVKWLEASASRIKANAQWMLRQRRLMTGVIPGGDRLWCKGLQPALQVTPDSGGLWMQFYECEAYYWLSIARLATVLSTIDTEGGARLMAESESYRKDLLAAVERSIALSPVVPVRDGTFHSVIPFACYVRGLSTGAWGWMRDGSGMHVGPLYWETVQSAAALISPAGLLPANDVRVQGYLDVLEDRLLSENLYVAQRCNGDWLFAGWQYQSGLERTANMHLAGDDIPVFLRSFLNGYAVEVLPKDGFIFNEHTAHGPPDKIFEEAAFLERFRNLLVMEDGEILWLARGTPRAWLEQGQKISVKNAPTHFGAVDYAIISDVDHGMITATVNLPSRKPPKEVWLRLRHPKSAPIKRVTVDGNDWNDFDSTKHVVKLHDLKGSVDISIIYQTNRK